MCVCVCVNPVQGYPNRVCSSSPNAHGSSYDLYTKRSNIVCNSTTWYPCGAPLSSLSLLSSRPSSSIMAS